MVPQSLIILYYKTVYLFHDPNDYLNNNQEIVNIILSIFL